jgi:hypothetical protein
MKAKKTLLITSELLKKFLKKKHISSVIPFLVSLEKKSMRQDFYNFLSKHGCTLQTKHLSPVLFHGSNVLTSMLNQHRSTGAGGRKENESLVYATDDPNYAIFLAVLNLKNGGAGVVAKKGKQSRLTIDLDFVNGTSKLQPGFVHVVSAKDFAATGNREYVSKKETEVLFSIRVTPSDLTVPIVVM